MSVRSNETDKFWLNRKIPRKIFVDILILIALLWLLFALSSRALRNIAFAQLQELTNTKIKAEAVKFKVNGVVLIRNLVIEPEQKSEHDNSIFRAHKIYVRFGIGSLLRLRPRLRKIHISDFVFNAQHDQDNNLWNLAGLKMKVPHTGSGEMPIISLKRGVFQYSTISNGKIQVAAEIPIKVKFGPNKESRKGYSFNIITAYRDAYRQSTLEGFWEPGSISVAGGVSSKDISAFDKTWIIDVLAAQLRYDNDRNFSLSMRIKDLFSKKTDATKTVVSRQPQLLEKFGPLTALQRFFGQFHPWGQIDIDLEASGNLDKLDESDLSGKIYCKNVAVHYYKFPYSINRLAGEIEFTQDGILLDGLQGMHENVNLTISGWKKGFGSDSQYQFQMTSGNMALDKDLYDALNDKHQKLWSTVEPSGLAAINYSVSRDRGKNKQKALVVKLLGGEAQYKGLPYPLKNLSGQLFFHRKSVSISDLTSEYDGRKIILNGNLSEHNTGLPIYDISIEARRIPLDSTLVSAMPMVEKDFRGLLDQKGEIVIEDFQGKIFSDGTSKKPSYHVKIHSKQLELNDYLLNILAEQQGEIISGLQANGKIDVTVELNKQGDKTYPDYQINVDCLGNSFNFELFPYPLKDITGQLTITKDYLKLNNIVAAAANNIQMTDDASKIKIDGQMSLKENAFEDARFVLSAENIFLDDRFGAALPEALSGHYKQLSPTGRVDVNNLSIKISKASDGQKQVDFHGAVKFKSCSFNSLSQITQLDAVLASKGSYKSIDGFEDTEALLFADHIRVKGKALTSLRANIFYDKEGGSFWSEDFIADCYDGRMAGRFELKRSGDADWQYSLQGGFYDINLKQLLEDKKVEEKVERTSGKMSGAMSINGNTADISSRRGRCRLKITDMQVGKLSAMAKLLTVLKLTEPQHYAFDQMVVDSYIKGGGVLVDKLDLSGRALAFKGSGRIDFQDHSINLSLTSRGRRDAEDEPGVFQSLTEGLSQAVIRMDITGDFRDPEIKTTKLPVIQKTFGILGTRKK